MGAILAVMGIGGAVASSNVDKKLFGDGDRGCDTRGDSKSFSKFKMSGCKKVSYAKYKLRPQKYPHGAGLYVGEQKVPSCYIPNSCRRDCDGFERFWKSVKRQFTHLNKESLIRRILGETCYWKKDGHSCEGVPCSFYQKQAQKGVVEVAELEEARWAKILDDFGKSPLGKFLNFVPIVGSELEILFKDIKGERPNEGDWISFSTDSVK